MSNLSYFVGQFKLVVVARDTKIAKIFIQEGILHVIVHDNQSIELRDVDAILPEIDAICDGERYPILLDTGINNKVTTSARQFIAERFKKYRTSEAIICRTYYHRILTQLYISVNRPGNPVKVFNNHEEAQRWLKENYV